MSTGPLPGWPHAVSPFHEGERIAQAHLQAPAGLEQAVRHVMRTELIAQHRAFFPLLSFLVVGALDAGGRPWATLLEGAPGFAHAADAGALRVQATVAPDDPLAGALAPPARVGLLGIDPATRRRNRLNGHIATSDALGFTVAVEQSYGNCPQYIVRRDRLPDAEVAADERGADTAGSANAARRAPVLDADARSRIRRSDTFFIASWAAGDDPNTGADVSHRGGRPGFVSVSDDGSTLRWPEFSGNRFANTLGNLVSVPRAGLLWADPHDGTLVQVTGRTRIDWSADAQAAIAGARCVVTLQVEQALVRPARLRGRWTAGEASPQVARTGTW